MLFELTLTIVEMLISALVTVVLLPIHAVFALQASLHWLTTSSGENPSADKFADLARFQMLADERMQACLQAGLAQLRAELYAEAENRNKAMYRALRLKADWINKAKIAEIRAWFLAELPKFDQLALNWFLNQYAFKRSPCTTNGTSVAYLPGFTQPNGMQSNLWMWGGASVVSCGQHTGRYLFPVVKYEDDGSQDFAWGYYDNSVNPSRYLMTRILTVGWSMFSLSSGKSEFAPELARESAEQLFDAAFPAGEMHNSVVAPAITVRTQQHPNAGKSGKITTPEDSIIVTNAAALLPHVIQYLYSRRA